MKTPEQAAQILFQHGWTTQEIESVLYPQRIFLAVGKEQEATVSSSSPGTPIRRPGPIQPWQPPGREKQPPVREREPARTTRPVYRRGFGS